VKVAAKEQIANQVGSWRNILITLIIRQKAKTKPQAFASA
jgi:hypothetical protein